jgi:cell division septation protein DedD
MRKILIGFVVVAVIAVAAYFHLHRPTPPVEAAYAANREVTVWSTTAQVRSPVATANFGEPLGIMSRYGDQVQVRTATGIVGWVGEHDLLSAEFWQKAKDLDSTTSALPIEAHGHTRVLSNLHLDPGRDSARIRQVNKGVPIELFERRVEAVPPPVSSPTSSPASSSASTPATQEASAAAPASTPSPNAKKEDWWLVRAHLPDQTTMSGWIIGRFIDLDVPAPLPDYASSAGMRIVAWFELNRVSDAAGDAKPQYLVVGDRGAEGQPCDFTLMRVFTWGAQRDRYETAFVESDVCGKLPVKLTRATASGGDASFTFEDLSGGAPEQRLYRMHQTIVRRVHQGGAPGAKPASHKKRLMPPSHGHPTSAGGAKRK